MILTSSSSRLLAPSHSHKNHFPRHPKSHLYTSSIQVPNSFTTCIFCKEVWYALLCFIENISCLTHLSSWNLTFFPSPIFQVTSKLSHLPWSFSPQTFPRSFHHIDSLSPFPPRPIDSQPWYFKKITSFQSSPLFPLLKFYAPSLFLLEPWNGISPNWELDWTLHISVILFQDLIGTPQKMAQK